MIETPVPCWEHRCRHYQGIEQPDGTEATERHVCAAFPDGIPGEIVTGQNMHRNPYPGDHGIQYEREGAMVRHAAPSPYEEPLLPVGRLHPPTVVPQINITVDTREVASTLRDQNSAMTLILNAIRDQQPQPLSVDVPLDDLADAVREQNELMRQVLAKMSEPQAPPVVNVHPAQVVLPQRRPVAFRLEILPDGSKRVVPEG